MAQDERRRHARLALSVDVNFTSQDNFFSGRTRDISAGGVFIATDVGLPVGSQLTLHLKLVGAAIHAPAEVTWVLLDDAGEVVGLGVRFLELTAPARTKIDAFMRRRDPVPFEMMEPDDDAATEAPPVPAAPARPVEASAAARPKPPRPR
jgi:uncharacterized protein (TIGR02266 family)